MNWEGTRVLVTGACGFIGSHLAEELVRRGATVRAFAHYNALGCCGWLDGSKLRDEIEICMGDIQDRDRVKAACGDVEIVFHLAALIGIPYSYHAPVSYVRTNTEGTLNVLQAARELDVKRVIHTSTSEVYGTAQYVPMDEAHPQQGQSPYSASKIAADKMAEAFHRSFGVPVVTVRPFNTYGPRQSARALIPTIITQLIDDETIRLGNLHPTRDLLFVADTIEGFLSAAEFSAAVGKTINLGTGHETSVRELVSMIAGLMGRTGKVLTEQQRERPEASEVDSLCANISVARKLLDWEPRYALEEGLRITIEWMKEHLEDYRPQDYAV